MESRVAIVTGGTRGIGEAISIALKDAGYQVAAVYAGNHDRAKEFSGRTGISVYSFDVGDFEQCKAGVAEIENNLGQASILINNAGITRDSTLHSMTSENWNAVIQTNLTSCFNMCRCVIEGMREQGFGRIVNIGSVNGQAGQFGQANYSAAKAGMQGFTKALAKENASKGVTVNTVSPGYTDTDMVRAVPEKIIEKIIRAIPVGRLGTAEDIARCVIFLADEKNSFITGSTIDVNGGMHMF